MKSAVTVSLVPEAKGGPFVFWDDLAGACQQASQLGFSGIEIFPPGPEAIPANATLQIATDVGLAVAAVGSGAGWVKHKLSFTSPVATVRQKAIDFARSMVEAAGALNAPLIIGSMQGRWGETVSQDQGKAWLVEALTQLGEAAAQFQQLLLYEPLNRYETNLANTQQDGVEILRQTGRDNVKLLADLYHMNIEEANLPATIRDVGSHIGHVHFADSNRRAIGLGHTPIRPIIEALRAANYRGYLSAEVLPIPDSRGAAQFTIRAFREALS